MAQMASTDKVSKKAEPDTKIANPADGNRIYKVMNTFTDLRGQRWQTDDTFVCYDEAELKMRLDKGEIRADGEPPHIMEMGKGEWPEPKQPGQQEVQEQSAQLAEQRAQQLGRRA